MASNEETIHVVDMSPIAQYVPWKRDYLEKFRKDESIVKLSHEIAESFSTWGFMYMKNHGINEGCIKDAFDESEKFFKLDSSIKATVLRTKDGEDWGYLPFNVETVEKGRPFDFKESFNFLPTSSKMEVINKIAPNFMEKECLLFDAFHNLAIVLLYLLSMQLPVEDFNFLQDNHSKISRFNENSTITRLLHYPPINHLEEIKENQLRCGEHSDFGTISFVITNGPGLQVKGPSGDFVDVTPIPGTIIVNSADMLEIWSSGKFKSVKHRVALPKNLGERRQSIVFFCQPDNDITISCLDGSDKFKAVNPFEYLMNKIAELYV